MLNAVILLVFYLVYVINSAYICTVKTKQTNNNN